VRAVVAILLISLPVSAERYTMQRGETLEHVAVAHGCTTEAVERANHVQTTLLKAGTVVEVPTCGKPVNRARSRDDDKAKQALAVIDGASWVESKFAKLEAADGFIMKRPSRAYGTKHLIEHLRGAIAEVRALYPNVPTLAIGDISAASGGKISDHKSHQAGLDVDVGFYVTTGAQTAFADANSSFDLEANWALLAAFTRTAALDDGVSMIFLDYDLQHRMYDFAKQRGTPDSELEFIFQYPRGRDELSGLVRHWPGHGNHFHVRFKPSP
jgi:LysM repeat protein